MSAPERLDLGLDLTDPTEAQSPQQLELFESRRYETSMSLATRRKGRAGIMAARFILRQSLESKPAGVISKFENQVIEQLDHYLGASPAGPLLSPRERTDLVFNHRQYFQKISDGVTALPDKPTEDLTIRRQRAVASARCGRTKAYTAPVIENLMLVDSCRSWWRYLNSGEFQPIRLDDQPATVGRRVLASLTELMATAQRENLLIGSRNSLAADRLVQQFELFSQRLAGPDPTSPADSGLETSKRLTSLVGRNASQKTNFWLGQMWTISNDYQFLDPSVPDLLRDYDRLRLVNYRQCFDPLAGFLSQFPDSEYPARSATA